jgi:hypothetical protein
MNVKQSNRSGRLSWVQSGAAAIQELGGAVEHGRA